MSKHRYRPLTPPKLDIMTIDEVLGVFFRGVVIGADKFDRSRELAVLANDVRSILSHCRTLGASEGS
jgi:hypothetical protein